MDYVFYHADCHDGFCAAWLAHKAWPKATFVPVQYGEGSPVPLADLEGKKVLFVDFCPQLTDATSILERVSKLTILDHHKTARDVIFHRDLDTYTKYHGVYAEDKSGARLMWDYLKIQPSLLDERFVRGVYDQAHDSYDPTSAFWDDPAPLLVHYTEDRDLWRNKLPSTKEINAAVRSYYMDFAVWDGLEARLRSPYERQFLIGEGVAILRQNKKMIELIVRNARTIHILGHDVPCVNSSILVSEIGGELAKGNPFGVVWFQRKDGKVQVALRSTEDGVDVSEIAKKLGGGGHRNAAGYEQDFLPAPQGQ